jgi:hypothetical protein
MVLVAVATTSSGRLVISAASACLENVASTWASAAVVMRALDLQAPRPNHPRRW